MKIVRLFLLWVITDLVESALRVYTFMHLCVLAMHLVLLLLQLYVATFIGPAFRK